MAGIDWGNGDVRFRVKGLKKTLKALEAGGAATEDMKELMHAIGETVLDAARPRTPVKSGKLVSTLRAGKGKTKAVIRAGGAKAPYAGVIQYGWPAHNITAQPFLVDALASERQAVFNQLNDGLSALLKKSHLK